MKNVVREMGILRNVSSSVFFSTRPCCVVIRMPPYIAAWSRELSRWSSTWPARESLLPSPAPAGGRMPSSRQRTPGHQTSCRFCLVQDPWPSEKLSLLSRAGPLAIRQVVALVSCRTPSHQTSCRFGLVQDPKPSDNLSLLSCVGPLAIRHVVAFVLCWTPGHLPKLSLCLVQDPWPSGKFLLCLVQDTWPLDKLSLLSCVGPLAMCQVVTFVSCVILSGSSDRN